MLVIFLAAKMLLLAAMFTNLAYERSIKTAGNTLPKNFVTKLAK